MTEVLMPYADAAAAGACEAGTRRWLERAVIGLNLCPFAKAVYNKKQIRFAVTAARSADELLAELAHELELLVQSDPQELDTTLLIHHRDCLIPISNRSHKPMACQPNGLTDMMS